MSDVRLEDIRAKFAGRTRYEGQELLDAEYLLSLLDEAREAIHRLRSVALSQCHYRDGACEYDRVGTGASGMSPQPCSKFRADSPTDYWCYACRLDAPGAADLLSRLTPKESR